MPKFYDPKLNTIDGWMNEKELEFLYSFTTSLLRVYPTFSMIEVGSWKGRSGAAFIQAIIDDAELVKDCPLYRLVTFVDNWSCNDVEGMTNEERLKAKDTFMSNLDTWRSKAKETNNLCILDFRCIDMDSSTALLSFPLANSKELIFIDADHTYEGCKRDIEAAWPLVKQGGYILGHDYRSNHPTHKVKQAVDELFGNDFIIVKIPQTSIWCVKKEKK
ncbi:class I SAM-dependent methyltransferase [Dolichospermum sp. ST_sed5]|nr:class I SAM-dependent methyltransferase [Dolichospermum sp. ST_sed5]